jgi:hypothetical protein
MMFVRFAFPSALFLMLASCKPLDIEVTSKDCTLNTVPAGFTRIYIGVPVLGGQQAGTSADDPLDGTSADKFDTILRTIAEGLQPTWGAQKNIAPENLIVCIGGGTFHTNGQFDWRFVGGHTLGSPAGFTIEKNWKVHGSGLRRTTLQLASYVPADFVDLNGFPFRGGRNVVLGTHSQEASGIEISDLTVDASHDRLTHPGGPPLNLAGIVLRSLQGGHWIHNVNVIGGSGDAGFPNVEFENFIVRIWGHDSLLDSNQSTGNLIENIFVGRPGHSPVSGSPLGGAADGIVVSNAKAEVRNNVVEGYAIGYGGWNMNEVWFHDNVARDTIYGFNADSFSNNNVTLQSNQFIHPAKYGIIIGGCDHDHTFSNWNVLGNSVTMSESGVAIGIRGQVQNSNFMENTIQTDRRPERDLIGIWSYASASGLINVNNSFQNNHIDNSMRIDFSQDPNSNTNCRFQNRDLQGFMRPDFPDNSAVKCR